MAKLSQLINKSYKEASEINTSFQNDQENRAEMRAKIFSRSGVSDAAKSDPAQFDPKRSAEKLRKMQEDDKILKLYKDKINDVNKGSTSDNLLQKAMGAPTGNPIDIDNYESKILDRLNATKRIFIDTINKLSETHPGLLYKNSTFGGIIMNPLDNINELFNKLQSRIISVQNKPINTLESKINPDLYDLVTNTSQISSKLNKLTYNMNIDQMSDLMTELMIEKNIGYNFSTPDLLSLSKNSRPIVVSDGNTLLSLYNDENLNFIFNTNFIDDNFNTKYGIVNYFKDTYAPGFIEKAIKYNTFFKDLEKINNTINVDYLKNEYANGFTSNFREGYSLYKTADGFEIGYGNIKKGIFSNKTSRLSDVDFLSNTYANGFISNSIKFFSQYKNANNDPSTPLGIVKGESRALFANAESKLSSVDFLSNKHAYGFVSGLNTLYSYFNNSKDGKSRSDIGFGINIKNNMTPEYNVNWLSDEFANGFISNAQSLYSYYMDISRNQIGDNNNNQAIMFSNRSSWLKVQNNLNDRFVDGFDINSRFHYSYYKMKNGKRLGILNGNIVGFFDTEYKYPEVSFNNQSINDYRDYGWAFSGDIRLMVGDGSILLGQSNYFSNIYNVGFISNKPKGNSDFNGYNDGNYDSTYSNLIISALFDTLNLESKIGSSKYENISAVNYLSDKYSRGFILNSTKGYSYFQYKHGNNLSDVGFLASNVNGVTNENLKAEYGNVGINYNNILNKFSSEFKYSLYKYMNTNNQYVLIANPQSDIDFGNDNFNKLFFNSTYASDYSKFNQAYKNNDFGKYTHKYISDGYDRDLPSNQFRITENTFDNIKTNSKLYYHIMIYDKSNYDLNRIPIYNFNTQNYIGVLRNTITTMKKAYDDYFKNDAKMLGKFSFTKGFIEPSNKKLYKAFIHKNENDYKSMFDENVNSAIVVIGNDVNGVLGSLKSPNVSINQNSDFISSTFELGSNTSNALNNLLNAGLQGIANTAIFTALSAIPGLSDFDKVNQSPLIFHTIAGHIYGATVASLSLFGVNLGGITNRLTGAVGVLGGNAIQAAEELKNTMINDAISGMAGGNVDRWLDTKSLMQMAQILLGDKYTKSYAFYDEELANNGQYGVPTPSSKIDASTNIGFLGNRETGGVSIRGDIDEQPGILGAFENIGRNIGRLFGGVGVDSNKISNEGLKKRLNMRSGGTSVNLYDSENTYKQALYDQIDNAKDISIMNDGFGRSRNNVSLAKNPIDDTDLIDFYFFIENNKDTNNRYLHFRADIKGITNSVSAEWNSISYVGRPDKFYIYQGFERKGGVDFSIAPDNKEQFKVMWDKVNTLIGLCMPMEYSNDISMVPAIVKCKIGNYINDRYIVINSVNTNIESAYPWDIDDQLPQIIDVSMDFTILYDELPQTYLNNNDTKWHIGKKLSNIPVKTIQWDNNYL